jgi:flagellar hook protein FlgE
MSFLAAFDNGVAAMSAHSRAMDAISQNISNLRTPGYKRAEATFSSLLQGIDVKPYEPGGVRADIRRFVDIQGNLEGSDRPLDIAINGKGMFIYSSTPDGGGDISYSRRGSLFADHVDDATTPSGYLTAHEDLYLMAWELDSSGTVLGTGLGEMVAVPASYADQFDGRATSSASLSVIIPADGTPSATTQISYFDATGTSIPLTLTWTNAAINTWDLVVSDANGVPLGATETMTFDGLGNLTSAATISAGGLFNLDVSTITQRGSVFFRGLYVQDGLGAGAFTGYSIDARGVISGSFAGGAVVPLYQIPLALFSNPNGLNELAQNLWVASGDSGGADYLAAGDIASIEPGTRELANVDLAEEFTQLIVTQRAYSSAATLIRTADEMTETARDLKR